MKGYKCHYCNAKFPEPAVRKGLYICPKCHRSDFDELNERKIDFKKVKPFDKYYCFDCEQGLILWRHSVVRF